MSKMPDERAQRGFSLIEMLISLTVMLAAMAGLAGMLIQNSRINKSQQMQVEVQANARNSLSLIVAKLRSAGWDPLNAGLPTVALDTDLGDDISEIEIFADLETVPDGFTTALDEQVLIRHVNEQIVWRRNATSSYIVLSNNISNDADGDGTIEPMFQPDADPPSVVTVRITARSPVQDPVSGDFIRYTVSSDVVLRKTL